MSLPPKFAAEMLRRQRRLAIPIVFLPMAGALSLLLRFRPTPLHLTVFATLYALTVLGITVGYHRLLTHRSFEAHPTVRLVLIVLGAMAGEGPPMFWAATHRRHHHFSDQLGDPHSPVRDGVTTLASFVHAHVGWMFTEVPTDPLRHAADLMKDQAVLAINRHAMKILAVGILLPGLLCFALEGPWGLVDGIVWGGLFRMFVVQNVTWSINSVCHVFGRRRFPTREGSRNNWLLGLLAFGEGWHNNHHADQMSAAHGLAWFELDVSWLVIRLLRALGFVTHVHVADIDGVTARLARRLDRRDEGAA
jgi:stearoyl-CoA desaturase (delta-9 desaturase)